MARPRVMVLRAPGTNCDEETAHAFARVGGEPVRAHVRQVLESPQMMRDAQVLCVPGGFSYGDDLAAGRIFASQLRRNLADACAEFRADGKLILGICNGFQVLIKSGLLDIEDAAGPAATLAWNDSGRYEARWVRLRATPGDCVFLRGVEEVELPIAHAEGKFVPRDAAALEQLTSTGQVVLRYTSSNDGRSVTYPENPNGSVGDVAGLCDRSGRVLGLMPHPERYIDPTQHPTWTRGPRPEVGAGLAVFDNAVRYFD